MYFFFFFKWEQEVCLVSREQVMGRIWHILLLQNMVFILSESVLANGNTQMVSGLRLLWNTTNRA